MKLAAADTTRVALPEGVETTLAVAGPVALTDITSGLVLCSANAEIQEGAKTTGLLLRVYRGSSVVVSSNPEISANPGKTLTHSILEPDLAKEWGATGYNYRFTVVSLGDDSIALRGVLHLIWG